MGDGGRSSSFREEVNSTGRGGLAGEGLEDECFVGIGLVENFVGAIPMYSSKTVSNDLLRPLAASLCVEEVLDAGM